MKVTSNRYKQPMNNISLAAGICTLCSMLSVSTASVAENRISELEAVENGQAQVVAQQEDSEPQLLQVVPLGDRTQISQLRREGDRLLSEGSRQSRLRAIEIYEELLVLLDGENDRFSKAYIFIRLGVARSSLGEKRLALENYEQALQLFETLDDAKGQATALRGIGGIYNFIGEKQAALAQYERALSLQREIGDKQDEAATLSDMGSVYQSIGEQQKALEHYEQALLIQKEIGNREGEAATLSNMGAVYYAVGELEKALNQYEMSLAINRDLGNRIAELSLLNNAALVYKSLGDSAKALSNYESALTIAQQMGSRASEATLLNNIAGVYREADELEKALDYYLRSLPLLVEVGNKPAEAATLSNLGTVYDALGQPEEALTYHEQALPMLRAVGDRPSEASTLNNLAVLYNSTGEEDKALEYYEQSLTILREVGDRPDEAVTLGNIALLRRKQNQLPQALENISQAIALIEDIRTGIGADDLRANYFATVQHYYQLKANILMQMGEPEAAFETSEAARARVLVELLNEANVNVREGVPPELLAEEDALKEQLLALDRQYAALRSREHEYEEVATLDKQSDDILQQMDRTLSKIRQVSPAYAEILQPQPLSLTQIQNQVLDQETVLMQYLLGEAQSYLWIVGANGFESYTLPSRREIETVARQFRSATSTNSPASAVNRKGKELTALILPELPTWVEGKRLIISGDGVLSELAFSALPIPNKEDYTPLLIEHEVLTQSSVSSVSTLRQQFAQRETLDPSVFVLADPVYRIQDERVSGNSAQPSSSDNSVTERNLRDLDLRDIKRLPFTRTEAESILAAARNLKQEKAIGFDASYERFLSENLSDYSIVHLATHGFINPINPQLSGVVLNLVTPEGNLQDNGFLRLHDIFNLDLNAELVVLSACQTGLGENISGEGIVGLSRGFMYAGAERVLVSLWNVNDESTAALMGAFYRYMLEDNMPPAAALRAAQKEQWLAGESPYKWAAFTLQGEWQ